MFKKMLGLMAAGIVAMAAVAQPAEAQQYYAPNYGYGYGYDYGYYYNGNYVNGNLYNGNYSNASYYNPNYNNNANRNWNYNYGYSYNPYDWNRGYSHATYVKTGKSGIALNCGVGFHVEPSVGAPTYGWLEPGTRLTLLGAGNGWAKVRSRWGTVGYIPTGDYYGYYY